MNGNLKRKIYSIVEKITKKKRVVDVTGVILTPGNGGKYCKGNGEHRDWKGKMIECCCDECDYFLLCFDEEKFL